MPTVREMLAKLPPNRPEQCFSIVAVHGLALATFAMVLQWCKEDFPDGIGTGSWDSSFSWEEGDAHVFNWHPVLMVTAFVFIFAEAAIAYTWLPVSKPIAKAIHVALQSAAIIVMSVGLVAVFRFHNEADPPIDNLYSMHSWVGMAVVVIFCVQYLAGLYHFLVPEDTLPNTDAEGKAMYLAYHKYAGIVLFVLAVAAACLGLFEKMAFMNAIKPDETLYPDDPRHLAPAYYRANIIAVLMTLLSILVAVVISRPRSSSAGFASEPLLA